MTSDAKKVSNRANAAKSCGPKTAAGKSRTRYNALKLGVYAGLQLLHGEDPKAFDRIRSKLARKYAPDGPDDDFLVERLAACILRDNRLKNAEWAALKRAEIKAELCERAKGKEFLPSDADVDAALRRALARDEDRMHRPDRAKGESGGSGSSGPVDGQPSPPPLSYTLLKFYGYGSDSKHCDEIDRRIRANNAEIIRLQAALEFSRKGRHTDVDPS